MKVVYIHKGFFQKRPPVISAVTILNKLGYDITLITAGLSQEWADKLMQMNIKFFVIECKRKTVIGKLFDFLNFRKKTFSLLEQNGYTPDNTLLWIENANTLVALGNGIKRFKYNLQLQELYDQSPREMFYIRRVINDAEAIYMPEYNRCAIYRVWFKLKKTPYLLPNKTYFVPSEETLAKLKEKHKKVLGFFTNKKVILYQGIIHKERDLSPFVKAVKELGGDFLMVLLGDDYGMIDNYKRIDPNVLHIKSLPAPDYLAITSCAYIGVVTYDPLELNTTFCAPNKIYEYGYYGLPMIGNDIPGLRYSVGHYNAGVLVDAENEQEVKEAIVYISNHYEELSKNSKLLYESTDNIATIKQSMNAISL